MIWVCSARIVALVSCHISVRLAVACIASMQNRSPTPSTRTHTSRSIASRLVVFVIAGLTDAQIAQVGAMLASCSTQMNFVTVDLEIDNTMNDVPAEGGTWWKQPAQAWQHPPAHHCTLRLRSMQSGTTMGETRFAQPCVLFSLCGQ